MPNVLDEYLIRLGTTVDQAGIYKFQNALRQVSSFHDLTLQGMAKTALKAETEIAGGFIAIGTAALGMVDKVAMADQQYRLFAMHMYMSKESARSLKIAMDALHATLGDMAWDPELRSRAHQLMLDQAHMAPGGDFDAQMRKIRDIRFEFTRLEVEVEYLGMNVVQEFMRALGMGPDDLLSKLRKLNDWIIKNLPEIAHDVVQWFLPVWKDVKDVVGSILVVLADMATLFTNIVGILSGNSAIRGATFDFHKFAVAIQTVAHWLAVVVEFLAKITGTVTGAIGGGGIGGLLGTVVGGALGIPGGPGGIMAGGLAGGALGTTIGGVTGGAAGGVWDLYRHFNPSIGPGSGASSGGYDFQSIINGIIGQESGGNPNAVSSKGAIGLMQLMPRTAAGLGVNPWNPAQNVAGGTAYYRSLVNRYGGNMVAALGAYNAGPGRMDAFLAGKASLPAETKDYISRVLGRAGYSGSVQVGSISIQITQPNASAAAIQRAVTAGVVAATEKQTQRNLAQFQDMGY